MAYTNSNDDLWPWPVLNSDRRFLFDVHLQRNLKLACFGHVLTDRQTPVYQEQASIRGCKNPCKQGNILSAASYQPQYAPSTANAPPVSSPALPAPVQSPTYAQYQQQYNAPSTTTPSFTPAALPQSPPPAPPAQYQPPTPQAPAFQPSLIAVAPGSPSLARHNSVAYAPSATPSSQQQRANLARSNTVASYAPSQRQQYQAQPPPPPQQHQQPAIQAPPAPVALPQFPSGPTAAPQPTYSIYASSGFEQKEERKEALLIDL